MKRFIRKIISIMMCIIICISMVMPAYASDTLDRLATNDVLNTAIAKIMSGIGIAYNASQGNAEAALQGFKTYTQLDEDGFYSFVTENLHHDDQAQTTTIDADLYNEIIEYINELKNNNQVIQNVPYENLYVDKMDFEEDRRNSSLYVYKRYRYLLRTKYDVEMYPKLYRFGNVKNKYTSDSVRGFYDSRGQKKTGLPWNDIMNTYVAAFQTGGYNGTLSYTSNQRTGFYYLFPFYVYNQGQGKTNVGGNSFPGWVNELMTPIVGNYDIYFVGRFNEPLGTNRTPSLHPYIYDSDNDRLVEVGASEIAFNTQVTNQSGYGVINISNLVVRNKSNMNQITGGPYISGYGNFDFPDQIGWGYRYVYDDTNDWYYTPLIRSDKPGLYKVFATTNDLLTYLRGSARETINNTYNQNVSSVTINNDNRITYIYETNYPDTYVYDTDENPNQPSDDDDPGEDNPGTVANVDLSEVIELLEEILSAVEDIESGSGSGGGNVGGGTDLTALMAKLNEISGKLDNTEIRLQLTSISTLLDTLEYELSSGLNNVTASNYNLRLTCNDIKTACDDLLDMLTDIYDLLDTDLTQILLDLIDLRSKLASIDVTSSDAKDALDDLLDALDSLESKVDACNNLTTQQTTAINSKLDELKVGINSMLSYVISIDATETSSNGILSQILITLRQIRDKMGRNPKVNPGDMLDIIDDVIDYTEDIAEEAGTSVFDVLTAILQTKFPFSIPFTMHAILSLLYAPEQRPEFEIPIRFASGDHVIYETTISTADLYTDRSWIKLINAVRFWEKIFYLFFILRITPSILGIGKGVNKDD